MLFAQIVRTYYVADWNAIGALATAAAVVVALFQEQIKNWLGAPRLRINWRPSFTKTSDGNLMFHLVIRNLGRGTARNVEVFVSDLFELSEDGTWFLQKKFWLTQLQWTHSGEARYPAIPRMGAQLVDFFTYPGGVEFPLELAGVSKTRERLRPGQYVARVAVWAENCRPRRTDFLIQICPPKGEETEGHFAVGEPPEDLKRQIDELAFEIARTTSY